MKQTALFSSEQKLKMFGEGEWVNETDECEFEHANQKCYVRRVIGIEKNGHFFGGHFCGYVQVTPSFIHEEELCAYGGITFPVGELDHKEGCWVGFDCAHFNDIMPSMKKLQEEDLELKEIYEKFEKSAILPNPTYKNIEFVIEETKLLAEQINEILNKEKE